MFLHGWSIWWILLTLRLSASYVEIYEYDSHKVICSEGLTQCSMDEVMSFDEEENDCAVVQNLTPYVKLCCSDTLLCTLCLVIETEISISSDQHLKVEDHSSSDEGTGNPKASVTVCYQTLSLPTCQKVEFTVNATALTQKKQTKMSMVIFKPTGVTFSSKVHVFVKSTHLLRSVVAPSLNEVCHQGLQQHVTDCQVPRLNTVINKETNTVALEFAEGNKSLVFVCVQYEKNGICQRWNRMAIPLYSVAPCMCFQVWDDEESLVHSLSCPFLNNDDFQSNLWQNVSVSVSQGQMIDHGTMLLWNLSAPCRIEGEVWPCHKETHCREMGGFRQQLANGKWRQNSKGLWENKGAFEDINLQLSPCVMLTVKGKELGPFCFNNTDRWRWSLLVVSVLLLISFTALIFCFIHDSVKKWVWSCSHGGFVKITRKGHVVLLSPPEVNAGVSTLVCRLGSQLHDQGFNVSVDQWSRTEQCTLGPLPWLHSQLLKLNSRVVLILTHKALERTEEWAHGHTEIVNTRGGNEGLPHIWSPYSDVFTAALSIIQADKQLGRARERFLLVKFDSHPSGDGNLPKLLQGLPLFKLPSQTPALLAELTVGGARRRRGEKTWAECKLGGLDKWRTKNTADLQKVKAFKYLGVEKNMETKPLQHI